MAHLNWGDVPTWIGTGSFFIAAIAYWQSVADKQRDQASKISAWIGTTTESGARKRILRITNTSDAAVYDLFVRPKKSDPIFLPEIPAKDAKTLILRGKPPPAEGDAMSVSVSLLGFTVGLEERASKMTIETPPIFEFCDASGRWWKRTSRRKLKRIRQRTLQTVTPGSSNSFYPAEAYDKRTELGAEKSSDDDSKSVSQSEVD